MSACLHAAALVWPGSIRHVSARRGARVDGLWAAEAEAWLGPLRWRTAAVLATPGPR